MKTTIILNKNNLILLGLIIFAQFNQLQAQVNSSNIDKIITKEMIRQEIPGIAIGVYKKGVIQYTKGYGYLDKNRRTRLTDRTVLSWASISKTLTSIAALQLDERKSNFDIDHKVIKHYPYWTSKWGKRDVRDKARKSKITIRQLMQHKSGIVQYGRSVWNNEKNYKTDGDLFNANSSVDVFRDLNLVANPSINAKEVYSTQGYNLLGAVVDKVSGSYTRWVYTNIKDKLGLTSLKVSDASRKTSGFEKINGVVTPRLYNSTQWVLPGGGWQSNVKDLLKFGRGIMDKKLLRNTEALWTYAGKQRYQGLRSLGSGGSLRVWHGGTHPNVKTLMYIMPEKDMVVVAMIPAGYTVPFEVVRPIVKLLGVNREVKTESRNVCDNEDKSKDKNFAVVWRKSTKDAVVRRGYDYNGFYAQWKLLTDNGYQCVDIETYGSGSNQKWDGLFKKQPGKNAMWRGFDTNGFNRKWREMASKGYRLIDVETYGSGKNRKWAGIFVGGNDKYALYRNYSTDAFGKKRTELGKKGYKLIDIEAYEENGKLFWAGVWRAGVDGKLNRNFTSTDFDKRRLVWNKQGYRLIDVETYKHKGKRYWAGIWEKNSASEKLNSNLKYCEIVKKNETWEKTGHEIIDLEVY